MKVREASKEPSVKIGGSGLTGKALVLEEDKVGYSCYAVFLDDGTNLDISSAFGNNFNHIYYCISGEVCFECKEGTYVTLTNDTLIALTGGIEAKINTTTKTHLFITYVKECAEGAQPQKPFFYALDEIIGTERGIDWILGRSRRFLRQSDGFNISLHNTVAYEDFSSALQYKNNIETAYLIDGHLQYVWDDGKSGYDFYQVNRKDGYGTAVTMDQNDEHILNIKSLPSTAICIFFPALKGTETHDFTKTFSSF